MLLALFTQKNSLRNKEVLGIDDRNDDVEDENSLDKKEDYLVNLGILRVMLSCVSSIQEKLLLAEHIPSRDLIFKYFTVDTIEKVLKSFHDNDNNNTNLEVNADNSNDYLQTTSLYTTSLFLKVISIICNISKSASIVSTEVNTIHESIVNCLDLFLKESTMDLYLRTSIDDSEALQFLAISIITAYEQIKVDRVFDLIASITVAVQVESDDKENSRLVKPTIWTLTHSYYMLEAFLKSPLSFEYDINCVWEAIGTKINNLMMSNSCDSGIKLPLILIRFVNLWATLSIQLLIHKKSTESLKQLLLYVSRLIRDVNLKKCDDDSLLPGLNNIISVVTLAIGDGLLISDNTSEIDKLSAFLSEIRSYIDCNKIQSDKNPHKETDMKNQDDENISNELNQSQEVVSKCYSRLMTIQAKIKTK